MAYEGDALHRRIKSGEPITVDYLVGQLHTFVDQFVQTPPYHIVSSSLGGKVAVEFAAKYPQLVGRMVLLCPSGMGDVERLPIMEGVQRQRRGGDHPGRLLQAPQGRPRAVELLQALLPEPEVEARPDPHREGDQRPRGPPADEGPPSVRP